MDKKLFVSAMVKFTAGVVLEEGLPGYKEYKQKVRYRLIPYIW